MKPITDLDRAGVSKLKYILCDIDDTITENGKLTKESYAALWDLHDHGYTVIPVTGRPAGWCDLIIREWPVRAVIGENGAFVYYWENSRIQTLVHPSVAGPEIRGRLEEVRRACLTGVPGCRVARDQFARIYDLAIDFNEDEPKLGLDAAEKIWAICAAMGAQAKISSIHVNTWFGNYNKRAMAELFFHEVLHEKNPKEHAIFFGDSPNDEPMFQAFPISCAVANLLPFAEQMDHLPTYIAAQKGAAGFTEAAAHILSLSGT